MNTHLKSDGGFNLLKMQQKFNKIKDKKAINTFNAFFQKNVLDCIKF